VVVEGEVYFKVAHNPALPFRAKAGNIVAQDVGTAFVVRARPGRARTQVIVASGRVALRDTNNRYAGPDLTAGQLGEVASDGTVSVSPVNASAYTAWTQGQIAFDNIPLRDVLPELSRWFDFDLSVSDSDSVLARQPVSAVFARGSVTDLVAGVAALVSARTVWHEHSVEFLPRAASPPVRTTP
jgi:ferric-dicitrate binding protein FerR (iron transport regulator)